MRRVAHFASVIFLVFLISTPILAHAAISSVFQPIIAQGGACGCTGSTPAPDWNCVLQTTQILINDFVTFATIVITIFIAWAGFTYILSPTSPEKRQQANARILNAVIGLVIVLCAWLLVNTVMGVLYNGEFGPWNSILTSSGGTNCIIAKGPPPSLGTAIGGLLAGNNTSSTGNAAGGPPVAGGVGGSPTPNSSVPSGSGCQPQPSTGESGPSSAICAQAAAFYGTNTNVPNTDNGNKACAWSVNQVIQKAGLSQVGSNPYAVSSVQSALNSGRGTQIPASQAQCGDLIFANGASHVGVCMNTGCTSVLSNSSSQASFQWCSGSTFQTGQQGTIYQVTN